jgi:hypothetical protein
MTDVGAIDRDIAQTAAALAAANEELRLDMLQAAADAAGLVDPTPLSDAAGAAISVYRGDLVGAGLSLISMIPYAGDAIGKTAKGAKLLKKMNAVRKRIAALTAKLANLKAAKEAAAAKAASESAAKAARNGPCASCGGGKPKIADPRKRAASIASTGDFSTPPNKSVFYSGPGNRDRAMASGGVPIDKTPGGKELNDENLYGKFNPLRNEADQYWTEASQRFAKGASGDVTAFVRGASPDRVFAQTELPALLSNPNVSSINGMPTQLLRTMEANEAGSAFRAITGMAPL